MTVLSLFAATLVNPAWDGIAPIALPARPTTYAWSRQIDTAAVEVLPAGLLEVEWTRVTLLDPGTGKARWTHKIDSADGRQKLFDAFQIDDTVLIQWTTYHQGEPLAYTHLAAYAAYRGKEKFTIVLPSASPFLPQRADHKLVYPMEGGLGVIDPQSGALLGRWSATEKVGDLYTICPSLRGHPIMFAGGGYIGTKPIDFASAP